MVEGDTRSTGRRRVEAGVIVSLLLHGLIAGAFLLKLPDLPTAEPEPEAVKVELVEPPEEKPAPKPEEKKAEAEKPPAPKQETPKPPEPKPEVPKPEAPKLEGPKPPAPAPSAPKPEEAKTEPPKPEPPPPPAPQTAPKTEAPQQREAALSKVLKYGDKDAGPDQTDGGRLAAGGGEPEKTETPPGETAATPPDEKPVEEKPEAAVPMPDDVKLPEVDAAPGMTDKAGPKADDDGEAKTAMTVEKPVEQTVEPKAPAARPDKPDADPVSGTGKPAPRLTRAKKLYSHSATGRIATTAMDDLPRDRRIGNLCSTELNAQLLHDAKGYRPLKVPLYPLLAGTVLDVKNGAFRDRSGWYVLAFRCEVDEEATEVVDFSYRVGAPIPRSDYAAHRIPPD